MDFELDIGTMRSKYALCLRSEKRCSSLPMNFELVDASSPMIMTPSLSPLPNPAHVIA